MVQVYGDPMAHKVTQKILGLVWRMFKAIDTDSSV